VRQAHHVDLVLPDADGLDEHAGFRPAASMRSTASAGGGGRGPARAAFAIERMKMPGSSARSFMRIRSPEDRAAENGEDGYHRR